jgi:plasmid stability protein
MEVMMADVLIRLDDDLIQRFKVIAELKGRTLEEELREIISRFVPLTPRSASRFRVASGLCKQSQATYSAKI